MLKDSEKIKKLRVDCKKTLKQESIFEVFCLSGDKVKDMSEGLKGVLKHEKIAIFDKVEEVVVCQWDGGMEWSWNLVKTADGEYLALGSSCLRPVEFYYGGPGEEGNFNEQDAVNAFVNEVRGDLDDFLRNVEGQK